MKTQEQIRERLRQRFLEGKTKNPNLSVRGFAKQLKLPAGTVSLVLLGKRALSLRLALKFAQALYLDPIETARISESFVTEKQRKKGSTLGSANGSTGSIGSTKRRQGGATLRLDQTVAQFKPEMLRLSADQFHVMKDWYYFAILNLTYTEDFQNDPEWIASRLGLKTEQVAEALERLVRLKLLEKNRQGKWLRSHKQLQSTDEVQNLSVRYSHYQNLELAKAALDHVELKDRDFTWLTLPVRFERMLEMKQCVREFQDQFLEKFGEETGATEVLRVCVLTFPLTKVRAHNPSPKGSKTKEKNHEKRK